MSVGRVDDDDIHPRLHQRPRPIEIVTAGADRRRHPQAAMLILVGIGILTALVNVLHRDQPLQHPRVIHDRQLLDAMFAQGAFGFIECRAHRRGDQTFAGHHIAQRAIEVPLELQITIGENADQLSASIDDGHPGDLEAHHQRHRFPERRRGGERDGIQNHSALAALHPIHLGGLPIDGHVLVQYADGAVAGHRDRHFALGDRVHRGRNQRDVERDALGQARRERDVAGCVREWRGASRTSSKVSATSSRIRAEPREGPFVEGAILKSRRHPTVNQPTS